MTLFEQKTPQSKSVIVMVGTGFVAVVLLVLLIVLTITKKSSVKSTSNTTLSVFQNFYTTILTTGQSYVGQK
jgi:hypothetical protein